MHAGGTRPPKSPSCLQPSERRIKLGSHYPATFTRTFLPLPQARQTPHLLHVPPLPFWDKDLLSGTSPLPSIFCKPNFLRSKLYSKILCGRPLQDISNKPSHSESLDYPVNKKKWYIIDAKNIILERLASAIAYHIMGKDPAFPPSEHLCSFVVVVNAAKVTVPRPIMKTRTKGRSGKPAVLKKENLGNKHKKIPAVVIKRAVWDLLPMRRLGKRIVYHLKVYKGQDHPHEAQLPIKISLTNNENYYSGA